MQGEDGRDYVFLLKGHEDLRQDERVMQLFGQVNALLAKDRRNYSHDLSIQRYAVAPLSHNAGVVGWVPNTDTLHQLIKDYRDTRQVWRRQQLFVLCCGAEGVWSAIQWCNTDHTTDTDATIKGSTATLCYEYEVFVLLSPIHTSSQVFVTKRERLTIAVRLSCVTGDTLSRFC